MGLEGLDFTLPPEFTNPKRPHEQDGESHEVFDAKRTKTEAAQTAQQPEDDHSLEDGLALLVQNALSNVDDLVGQFDAPVDGNISDPMDIDVAALLESVNPPPTFFSDPLKYVRTVQTHTLGNLVCSSQLEQKDRCMHANRGTSPLQFCTLLYNTNPSTKSSERYEM